MKVETLRSFLAILFRHVVSGRDNSSRNMWESAAGCLKEFAKGVPLRIDKQYRDNISYQHLHDRFCRALITANDVELSIEACAEDDPVTLVPIGVNDGWSAGQRRGV